MIRRQLAGVVASLALLAACEDTQGPDGDTSTFVVNVYTEVDDSTGMGPTDLPVSATVTIASNADDLVLVDSTGPDGTVTFADLPPGAYTVTHVATAQPAGTELKGSASQTVVAPFAGGEVLTRFVYGFQEGSIAGVAYRDDNGSGAFEAGQDSVFPGVIVTAYAGTQPVGTPVAVDTTDAAGLYDLGELEQGPYTLEITVLPGTAIVGGAVRDAVVEPGETTFHELRFVGDPTGPVIDVADARARDEGDTVKVRGVVTAGQGTYRDDSFYVQDSTGGIFVFGVDPDLGLEVGDSVQVRGERSTTPWEEEQIEAFAVVLLGTGALPDTRAITVSDLNAGLFSGELATLTATVDSISATTGEGYRVFVHDATGAGVVFVDADTDIAPSEFTVDAVQTFRGILAVYDRDDDGVLEAGDYLLKPRSPADVS